MGSTDQPGPTYVGTHHTKMMDPGDHLAIRRKYSLYLRTQGTGPDRGFMETLSALPLAYIDYGIIFVGIGACTWLGVDVDGDAVRSQLLVALICGIIAGLMTYTLIPIVAEWTEKKGLFGRDLGKKFGPKYYAERHV